MNKIIGDKLKLENILEKTMLSALTMILTMVTITGTIDYFKKVPFKCVENNLYRDNKYELVNQNQKCAVINDEVYIYENENLKKLEIEDIGNNISEILEIEELEEREGK